MSYTVLARKWRPKNFSELVGQQHVMQALANALDQQRLHHAYLFTGTRGIGKTTIARIFAKALNCEQGISSKPCGQCGVCRSIDEGRFVDLIEVDAASRTKVEDTRELLENVQYAPVQGRFKVYLIDEVHMLSKSSFNALLKTLEEPPEHVKFLLATTDPHKLPITVLSRCLQFNLMRLTPTQIQNHLAMILQQEKIGYEDSALSMIAKSADGSARDSLSILDQAIAYGAGQVMFDPVQAMLGLVDQQFVVKILTALRNDSAQEIKAVMQALAQMGVDYEALNRQLIEVFHQLSLVQILGGLNDLAVIDESVLMQTAQSWSADKVQMLYQIALLAQQDMRLAPDIRIGFEMALLRMLAFKPGAATNLSESADGSVETVVMPSVASAAPPMPSASTAQQASMPDVQMAAPEATVMPEMPAIPTVETEKNLSPGGQDDTLHLMNLKEKISQSLGKLRAAPAVEREQTVQQSDAEFATDVQATTANALSTPTQRPESQSSLLSSVTAFQPEPMKTSTSISAEEVDDKDQHQPIKDTISEFESQGDKAVDVQNQIAQAPQSFPHAEGTNVEAWVRLIQAMQLEGWSAALANQSMLVHHDANQLVLSVDPEQMPAKTELAVSQLQAIVQQKLGCALVFVEESGEHWTPTKYWQQQKDKLQEDAVASIYQDPSVQGLMDILNMRVIDSSIQSLDKR